MSILDWLDVYREGYESLEWSRNFFLAIGKPDDISVRKYDDYKRGYETLLIEYQSTSTA